MKTVLMIAPYFVPRRRVGSLRPFKFAIHLQNFGYKPVVVTIADPGSKATDLEEELLDKIDIIEIDTPFDRTTQTKKKSVKDESDGNPLLDWIDRNTPLDSWIYLFLLKYLSIESKAREIDPDIVWATGDPWSGLWLGERIARKFSKSFVADFRDPWNVSNVNLRDRSDFSQGIDQQIEKRVVKNADKLIFTSKETQNEYIKHFNLPAVKTETIYNSYDLTLAKEYKDQTWGVELDPKFLNIIFFGRFRPLSPVTPVADALRELKKMNSEDASYIHIHSFGDPGSENLSIIREYDLEDTFIFHEPVVPEKMLPVLKSADILLLSTNMKRHQVIPAKLWDYLSVEIPILSITPNAEVGDIIMRSKAGIQVHPKEKREIAELLQSFAKAKRNHESFLLSPEKEIPDRDIYEAKHTTEELASVFDDLLKNG